MTTMARAHATDHTDVEVTVAAGVDTHQDTHTAAVIDTAGRLLGHRTFAATGAGYAALLVWVRTFGVLQVAGIEGSGSYGAGLARYLRSHDVAMLEIDRPDRKTRRTVGKSDPIDAHAAARAALARVRTGVPKAREGRIEALRNLRVARRSAVRHRADCLRQIKTLIVTAPDELRTRLRTLSTSALLKTCTGLRPHPGRAGEPEQAVKFALRHLAHRHTTLTQEITELDTLIKPLVAAINPALLQLKGVGTDTAGQLLVTAGDNTQRLHSEAAFAMLCGAAPIPASSGKTHRHRLNRGGDRQANAALHRIVVSRLRWDTRTQHYKQRRTTEGLSTKDIIRCLKRHIAREIYHALTTPQPPTTRHP
jgi:transposase